MEFYSNKEKEVEIKVNGSKFLRHAIKTRFIKPNEDYIDILRQYVMPIYQKYDIISISEKIIALCQNRIVRREDLKIGFFAKLLVRFVGKTPAGPGVGEVAKMQYTINKAGLIKVLFASFLSAVTKLFGIKGMFYKIVGQEVSGLDGFYGKVFEEYKDMGIEIPENPVDVCNEINEKLGISCMIVDCNDLGQEIYGKSSDIKFSENYLKQMIRDNPAGQGDECTPFILIRKKGNNVEYKIA